MCGIAGFINEKPLLADLSHQIAKAMGDKILHRGPDSSGVWCCPKKRTFFVHRRLAIIDTSSAGNQPMLSPSGRYTVVFNGEIYNHFQLRKGLEKRGQTYRWQGHSDTETLLACIEEYGIKQAVLKLVGMFAIAVHDGLSDTVTLVRDRVGEKPLYYGWQHGQAFFASELKALSCLPDFEKRIDRDALCLYLRHNYIPAPYSIYRDVRKLPPGCVVTLKRGSEPEAYWSFDETLSQPPIHHEGRSDRDWLEMLETALGEAVSSQMVADVPLGAFLSGGIDSSLIVALMQERTAQKVRTFSIGFENKLFNEAPFAKAVAAHLNTDHTELYVTNRQVLDVIPSLPTIYDEPFSDSSQIPTCLLSELTSNEVTVSLSGDAGDELFGGYNRYIWASRFWNRLAHIPLALRRIAATTIMSVPSRTYDAILTPFVGKLPARYRYMSFGDKVHKAAKVLEKKDAMEIYLQLISHWPDPAKIVLGGHEPNHISSLIQSAPEDLCFTEQMMRLDALSYLPDDILVKVDRAAMAHSLETRIPFLDHRVVEMSQALPLHLKFRDGQGKWCLRQMLNKRVPTQLIDRPKAGFGVPLNEWLRGPLKEWAGDLLSEERLAQSGYFDAKAISTHWQEHSQGKRDWHYYLWDILMFESWKDAEGL